MSLSDAKEIEVARQIKQLVGSLVAIWPQCHALYEKPLFERQTLVVNEDQQCQKTGTEISMEVRCSPYR